MKVLALSAALAIGEACGFAAFALGPAWPIVAVMAVVTAFFGYGWGVRGWRFATVFFLGLALALRSSETRQEVLREATAPGGPFTHSFVVESEPAVRDGDDVRKVSFNSSFRGVDVRVVFSCSHDDAPPEVGETWRCAGWLDRKPADDYSRRMLWVRGRGTYAMRDDAAGRSKIRAALASVRRDFSRRLGIGLDGSPFVADLNRAILLGERHRLGRDARDVFTDAGTLHIFAVSGLHVLLVAKLFLTILAVLFVPYRIAAAVVIPLVWLYVAMVGASPSAVRAAAMASAYFLAPAMWRRPDGLSAWAVAFVLFHVVEPENMVKVSSLLSFAVMLGILLFLELYRGLCSARFEPIGVSVAAWVAGVPIAAQAFGKIAFGGLFANIVLIPAAGVSLCAGALGVLTSYASTTIAAHLNALAALFTRFMVGVSWAVSRIPFAHCETGRWTLRDMAAWYGVIGLLTWLARSVALRRRGML